MFLDANPGIYAKVITDSLAFLSNMVIHRAELVVEQVPDDRPNSADNLFTPPNLFLTPYSTDSMRRFALPHDVIISGGVFSNPTSFGCFPSKKVDPITHQTYYVYNFDMSLYVQGIVTKHEKVYPLILYAPSNDYILPTETSPYYAYVYTGSTSGPLNAPAIGRVRVGGGTNTTHKMRIHIVYSDIK